MLDLEHIRRVTEGHGLVRAVDALPTGPVRLETAFSYPEGSNIDLFVMEAGTLIPELRLSDLGNTMAWLHDVQVKPWLSKKRQQFLQDAMRAYGATMNGGALELRLGGLDEIVPGVVRLGQTCLRAADLVYTRRSSLQVPANEDLEEVLADTSLPYESNVELEGRLTVFDDRHDVFTRVQGEKGAVAEAANDFDAASPPCLRRSRQRARAARPLEGCDMSPSKETLA